MLQEELESWPLVPSLGLALVVVLANIPERRREAGEGIKLLYRYMSAV